MYQIIIVKNKNINLVCLTKEIVIVLILFLQIKLFVCDFFAVKCQKFSGKIYTQRQLDYFATRNRSIKRIKKNCDVKVLKVTNHVVASVVFLYNGRFFHSTGKNWFERGSSKFYSSIFLNVREENYWWFHHLFARYAIFALFKNVFSTPLNAIPYERN